MLRKTYILAILTLLIAIVSTAQTYVVQVKTFDSEGWGYANLNGEIIIEPQFGMCYEFSIEGVAIAYYSIGNTYQLINLKGEFLEMENPDIIIMDYMGYKASGFENGLIPVRDGKKWGYMNTQGKIVIALKYDNALDFNNGYAIVELDRKFYVIDNQGNEVLIDIPKVDAVKKFSEDLAPYVSSKGLSGFINTAGIVVIPTQYDGVGYFNSDLAWARTKKGLIGFINKKGEWVIEPQFTAVKNFDVVSGLARVKISDDWCFVDKKGNLLYPKADKFDDYSEGLAKTEFDGKFGFMNEKQEWAIKPKYEAARDFKNGFAAVKLDDAWGIINKSGKWVLRPVFYSIKDVAVVN